MRSEKLADERHDMVETPSEPPPETTGFISLLGRPTANVSVEGAEAALEAARRDLEAARANFGSWRVRVQRLLGGGRTHQARLEAAERRYRARKELVERAREDALIARNVARLVAARQRLSAYSIEPQSESWIAAGPSRII